VREHSSRGWGWQQNERAFDCKKPDLSGGRSGLTRVDPLKEEERIIGRLVTKGALGRSSFPTCKSVRDWTASVPRRFTSHLESDVGQRTLDGIALHSTAGVPRLQNRITRRPQFEGVR
jgi:hypothetical protein